MWFSFERSALISSAHKTFIQHPSDLSTWSLAIYYKAMIFFLSLSFFPVAEQGLRKNGKNVLFCFSNPTVWVCKMGSTAFRDKTWSVLMSRHSWQKAYNHGQIIRKWSPFYPFFLVIIAVLLFIYFFLMSMWPFNHKLTSCVSQAYIFYPKKTYNLCLMKKKTSKLIQSLYFQTKNDEWMSVCHNRLDQTYWDCRSVTDGAHRRAYSGLHINLWKQMHPVVNLFNIITRQTKMKLNKLLAPWACCQCW